MLSPSSLVNFLSMSSIATSSIGLPVTANRVGKYRRDTTCRSLFNCTNVGNGRCCDSAVARERGLDDVYIRRFDLASRTALIRSCSLRHVDEIRLVRYRHVAEDRRFVGGQYVDAVVSEELREIDAVEGAHPACVARTRALKFLYSMRSSRARESPCWSMACSIVSRWRVRAMPSASRAPIARDAADAPPRPQGPRSATLQTQWCGSAIGPPGVAHRPVIIFTWRTFGRRVEQAVIRRKPRVGAVSVSLTQPRNRLQTAQPYGLPASSTTVASGPSVLPTPPCPASYRGRSRGR